MVCGRSCLALAAWVLLPAAPALGQVTYTGIALGTPGAADPGDPLVRFAPDFPGLVQLFQTGLGGAVPVGVEITGGDRFTIPDPWFRPVVTRAALPAATFVFGETGRWVRPGPMTVFSAYRPMIGGVDLNALTDLADVGAAGADAGDGADGAAAPLVLTTVPVPELSGLLLLAGPAAVGWVSYWRRRWHGQTPPPAQEPSP
jgi:hypothetical protein